MTKNELRFPKRFLWGVGTAAHQVEGGNHNNWSVWELENANSLAKAAEYKIGHLQNWPTIKKQARTPDNYVSGRAIDHYNRYETDFSIMRKMYLNAFRFSIEWSRVEPKEGAWDVEQIEQYRRYIRAMKKNGLEPIITLYHWTIPVWFAEAGGFGRAKNIDYFVRFAEKIMTELGSELRYIVTVNEPDTVASHGYWYQEHPPYKHNLLQAVWVYRNHLKAHKRVFAAGQRISRRFKIGFVKGYTHVVADDERKTTKIAVWFDCLVRDTLPLWYVGKKTHFLGVNYYFTDYYSGFKRTIGQASKISDDNDAQVVQHEGREELSDLGWSMEPENLEYVLKRLGRYKKPLIVTETGVADCEDQYRKNWLNGTIMSVNNALHAGVNVQGYLHWSAFDNFEWAYGRWPAFGLIGIDYNNDLKRVPRRSAVYYAAVVKKARGI